MAIDQKYVDEAVKVRRALHRRPEEGWTEFETTYLIVKTLKSYGFEDIQIGKSLSLLNTECPLTSFKLANTSPAPCSLMIRVVPVRPWPSALTLTA